MVADKQFPVKHIEQVQDVELQLVAAAHDFHLSDVCSFPPFVLVLSS